MKKKWKRLLVYAVCGVIVYAAIRCLFWVAFPFVIAYILMKLFYPMAEWIKNKIRISRGISVAALIFVFMGLLLGAVWWVISSLFKQLSGVFLNVSTYEVTMNDIIQQCCCQIEKVFGLKVEYVKPYLLSRIYQSLTTMGENISSGIMGYSYVYAKGVVKIIGVLVVIIVTTIVMTKDYERIQGLLKKTSFFPDMKRIKEKAFYAGWIYIRAQLIIITIIGFINVCVFAVMKHENALLLGTLIGIMDALPFFGTGSVLVPWAVIKMIRGQFLYAAVYGTLYLVCSFVREFLEPKLIGKSLGIPPLFIIASIYMGIVLFGITGVVLGPIQVLLTIEIGRQWIEDHS